MSWWMISDLTCRLPDRLDKHKLCGMASIRTHGTHVGKVPLFFKMITHMYYIRPQQAHSSLRNQFLAFLARPPLECQTWSLAGWYAFLSSFKNYNDIHWLFLRATFLEYLNNYSIYLHNLCLYNWKNVFVFLPVFVLCIHVILHLLDSNGPLYLS